MEKMMNSQSAAAVNSAKTSFMLSASTMFPFFGYNEKEITDELNKIDIVNFIAQSVRECKAKAQFILEFGDERYTMFLRKDDRGYYITVSETSSKTVQRPVKEIKKHYFICSRLTRNNIDDIANYVYGIVADYFYGYGIYEAPALEEATVLEEAPMLKEAPVLDEVKILEDFCTNEASKIMAAGLTSVAMANEEFYMYDYEALYDYLVDAGFNEDRAYEIRDQYDNDVDRAIRGLLTAPDFVPVEVTDSDIESTERFWDNITMPYSARGLAYVKENTSEVSMADIIRAVAEEHWDFESVVKESQWTRFTNDSFRDLIWSTCWAEYLVGYTDDTLEAETRYVMDFDSVYDDLFGELWPYMSTYDDSCGGCELWVDAWYVVERAAEIIEESVADSDTRCIDRDRFPDYMMSAFLDDDLYGFDTFTERVMSELEGGDIVSIMPYDDGLHLSFVDDEAEVAA